MPDDGAVFEFNGLTYRYSRRLSEWKLTTRQMRFHDADVPRYIVQHTTPLGKTEWEAQGFRRPTPGAVLRMWKIRKLRREKSKTRMLEAVLKAQRDLVKKLQSKDWSKRPASRGKSRSKAYRQGSRSASSRGSSARS